MAVLKHKSNKGTRKKLMMGSVDSNWVKGQMKDLIREKIQGLDPTKVTVEQLTTALQSIYEERVSV